jgi:hypothetical protein
MSGRAKGQRNLKRKRIISVHGYAEVFEPKHPCAKANGYVLEHRMVAWDSGLLTDKRMNVHHKNEDKTDNRLQNLGVIEHGKHISHHWKGVKRGPFSKERCSAISKRMKGNKNWRGNLYENPELLENKHD